MATGESHPKKLHPCPVPGCGCGMHVKKSWVAANGDRKQRAECSNGHRLTFIVDLKPDPGAYRRLMRSLGQF